MRLLLVVAAALLVVPTAAAWPDAALKVTVWPKGKSGPSSTWTLRCNNPGPRGTHPRPEAACFALARRPHALRPVPKRVACAQHWDGPQVALVRGAIRGRHIRTWFRRTDSCEIDRWDALRALFPLA